MRFSSWLITGALVVGISACDRPESAEDRWAQQEKTDQAAHKAGEEAYRAAQKTKELTREAVEKLRKAGHEVREGWEDAKHNDPEPDPPSRKR